jgi:hypothetical protein
LRHRQQLGGPLAQAARWRRGSDGDALMLLQSAVSLVTVALVAARAVNVLASPGS